MTKTFTDCSCLQKFVLLWLACAIQTVPLRGAEFYFGSEAGGGDGVFPSQSSIAYMSEGVTATFLAGPSGALLNDSDPQGLGVNSLNLVGVNEVGNLQSKVNILGGTSPLSGSGESISFSFNRGGVLKDLLFDGLKDETLEYFKLTFPNGTMITIFDSQTETRLSNQGYHLTDLLVPTPVQAPTENDDLTNINYPFLAGQVFTLLYGEGDYSLVPNYRTNPSFPQFPNTKGDGSRFQGVAIIPVPEPTSIVLFLVALMIFPAHGKKRGSKHLR